MSIQANNKETTLAFSIAQNHHKSFLFSRGGDRNSSSHWEEYKRIYGHVLKVPQRVHVTCSEQVMDSRSLRIQASSKSSISPFQCDQGRSRENENLDENITS